MGEVHVMVSTRAGARFARMAQELPQDVDEEVQGFLTDNELAFQAVVPKDSTRIARSVHSIQKGPGQYEIIADAQDPKSGYHYVGVTRFGHKKAFITPRKDRRGNVFTISTRRRRQTGKRAALRFVVNGRILFRAKVKAYQPDHDWVDSAIPEVRANTRDLSTRLGQRIRMRFS